MANESTTIRGGDDDLSLPPKTDLQKEKSAVLQLLKTITSKELIFHKTLLSGDKNYSLQIIYNFIDIYDRKTNCKYKFMMQRDCDDLNTPYVSGKSFFEENNNIELFEWLHSILLNVLLQEGL